MSNKEVILKLKEDIKNLSRQQVYLKDQRKSKYNKLDRTIDFYKASCNHGHNRFDLRYMFIVYGELRGKTIDEIEPNRKTEISERVLLKFRQLYPFGETVEQE